jgi:hypothetical protein
MSDRRQLSDYNGQRLSETNLAAVYEIEAELAVDEMERARSMSLGQAEEGVIRDLRLQLQAEQARREQAESELQRLRQVASCVVV